MSAAWVAASVRARAMARRRVGAVGSRRIAEQESLADGLILLADSGYGERLARCTDLAVAERATRDAVLWQLRVLAGWMPGSGAKLARAAAGAFERDNIVALSRRLDGAGAAYDPYELGALATSWRRLRVASSAEDLAEALRRSPWAGAGPGEIALRDVLDLVWLRRLADVAPGAQPWAGAGCALIAARILLVDHAVPSPRVLELVRPVLGGTWQSAADLAGLRASLPSSARAVLLGIESPADLWRAEAGLRATVEADGFRLLAGSRHGPGVVLGAIAVLAVDAWRVRAALAAAAAGTGGSEVLDAVA